MSLRMALALLCTWLVCACGHAGAMRTAAQPPVAFNSVAAYFNNAEIQAETDAQRQELRKALEDMLALPEMQLRAQRYADPSGRSGMRTLVELLSGHVVPGSPQVIEPGRFFGEFKAPEAQEAIKKTLAQLRSSSR